MCRLMCWRTLLVIWSQRTETGDYRVYARWMLVLSSGSFSAVNIGGFISIR